MSRNSVEEYRHGRCNIRIEYDHHAESPRTSHDKVGTMVCWHRRHNLGDEQPREEAGEYLLNLAQGCVSDRYPEALLEWNRNKILDKHFVKLPLYLYDHSGITISTGPFSCHWDSSQVGFIYCSLENAQYEWGTEDSKKKGWDGEASFSLKPDGTKSTLREAVIAWLEGEVEEYNNFLTGQCYGYVVEADGGEEESCWGFIGDLDYVKKEAESQADYMNKRQEEEDVEAAEMACRDIVTV